ncbi:MAG: type II toxin-antitoxin system HicA family toxin [Acidobacteriota bacterium]
MSKLPRDLKPKRVLKALERAGFEVDHVTGSHFILRKGQLRTSVPNHQTVKTGTPRAILAQCGISTEEFIELL